MTEIDYALAYDFRTATDPGVSYQLRFRTDGATSGDPWGTNPTGQLVAVVVDPHRADNGRTVGVSRPGIPFLAAENAVDRDDWPFITPHVVDLDAIAERIREAGLA